MTKKKKDGGSLLKKLLWWLPIIILGLMFALGACTRQEAKKESAKTESAKIESSKTESVKDGKNQSEYSTSEEETTTITESEEETLQESATKKEVQVEENGNYTSKEEVALYIHTYGKLPVNYITKKESWYSTSMVKKDIPEELLSKENIYILGSVSKNFRDIMDKIEEVQGKVCLDLGQTASFRYISLSKLKEMLTRKYYIVNLNERVAKYLLTRFGYNEYKELKQIFVTDMLIITKGKEEIEIPWTA